MNETPSNKTFGANITSKTAKRRNGHMLVNLLSRNLIDLARKPRIKQNLQTIVTSK